MNLDELYSKVKEKAQDLTFSKAQVDALILLDIQGEDPRKWLVTFKDQRASIDEFQGETPDVVVSATGKTILSIAQRTLKPTMAFLTGRLKIKGDKSLLTQLSQIWPD
ncbi:MAG: SCP2 sterol-binding domain-containing protein [Deltaproteobacteria bacterium]|jgi:putative sterol carrier protein|nr:SCP2 sterol-binding domain-containing protein [Deltaproteobacteria bacterium]